MNHKSIYSAVNDNSGICLTALEVMTSITIITPCCRPKNLQALYDSIQFEYVTKWYIVYDTSRGRSYTHTFKDHPKIQELECDRGISGNPQRNTALDLVKSGFVYFLDDDNIVHPDFWDIIPTLEYGKLYTWNQILDEDENKTRKGYVVELNSIDTAQYIIPFEMINSKRWIEEEYEADGIFISQIYKENPDNHKFIPFSLCYYNYLEKEKEFKIRSIQYSYASDSTELCTIGAKYDTDKSSQRVNPSDTRHCHPYTIFYHNLLKDLRDKQIEFAEIGILEGGSLRMWQEYFPSANIDGFEYNQDYIESFKSNYNMDRITLETIDVTNQESIKEAFSKKSKLYDIIIEDSIHNIECNLNVIRTVYPYLKRGGILIIEDIFLSTDEAKYYEELALLKRHFCDMFFVTLDHDRKNSTGWNNDKLLVLIHR